MVYQRGCGNRLLRGTGRLRGNLCPRGRALQRKPWGENLRARKNGRKIEEKWSEEKEEESRRKNGREKIEEKIEGRKIEKK
jgi:hypothetical protein